MGLVVVLIAHSTDRKIVVVPTLRTDAPSWRRQSMLRAKSECTSLVCQGNQIAQQAISVAMRRQLGESQSRRATHQVGHKLDQHPARGTPVVHRPDHVVSAVQRAPLQMPPPSVASPYPRAATAN